MQGPPLNLCHKVIVRSVPSTGALIGYLEVLGVLKIGGLFASGPVGVRIEHIYVYDVIQKADRTDEFSIDPTVFDAQDWRSVGLGPADAQALQAHFQNALASLVAYYRSRNVELATRALPEPSD
jgi:hypothetical protein